MRGIKRIIISIITGFMTIGLVGCSEKVYTEEEAKIKLEYDAKVSDMLLKAAEGYPNDSTTIFDENIKEIRSDVETLFKKSKENENFAVRDSIRKQLKELEEAFGAMLKENYDIQKFMVFFNLNGITDGHKNDIRLIYEKSKTDIEDAAIWFIDTAEDRIKTNAIVLNTITMVFEKDMSAYEEINEYYGLSAKKEYTDIYNKKVPEYKKMIDSKYTLDNSEISYLDVKNQSERENLWEEAKAQIGTELKSSGKLTFPSNAMSSDILMKKSGSSYIIKSYVDIEKGGSKERKEFIVKYNVSGDYYMLISATV